MVEYFATFFSKAGWECFARMIHQDSVGTHVHALGWGYDVCQKAFCPTLRFGIVHDQVVRHLQNPTQWRYPGRRLTLRTMSQRHTQATSIARWVNRHLNSSCVKTVTSKTTCSKNHLQIAY